MIPYWVTFEGRSNACVEAESANAAMDLGAKLTGHKAVKAQGLPYPALPRLTHGDCPPFCWSPATCAGRGSCPKNHACDD